MNAYLQIQGNPFSVFYSITTQKILKHLITLQSCFLCLLYQPQIACPCTLRPERGSNRHKDFAF